MKKSFKILMIFIVILCFCINFSYAEDDICKINLTSDETTLKAGDSVEINLSISNIKTSDGLLAVGGYLEYDPEIFEIVFVENEEIKEKIKELSEMQDFEILYIGDVENQNLIPWYLLSIESNSAGKTAILGSSLTEPQISTQEIVKIKLKVKSGAQTTTTEVKLSEPAVIDSKEKTYSLTNVSSIKYNISGTSKDDNDEGTYVQTINEVEKDNTSEGEAPYTGAEDVIIPSIFIIILGTISFIRYFKYKDVK